jgi:hypothetical protein
MKWRMRDAATLLLRIKHLTSDSSKVQFMITYLDLRGDAAAKVVLQALLAVGGLEEVGRGLL